MIFGSVKRWFPDRSYGFIGRDDQQKDVFFHARDVESSGVGELRLGERVEFDISVDKDGRQRATDLKRVR